MLGVVNPVLLTPTWLFSMVLNFFMTTHILDLSDIFLSYCLLEVKNSGKVNIPD